MFQPQCKTLLISLLAGGLFVKSVKKHRKSRIDAVVIRGLPYPCMQPGMVAVRQGCMSYEDINY